MLSVRRPLSRRLRWLLGQNQRLFSRRGSTATTTTYYDSQSGRHVAVHNENDVSVFLDATQSFSWTSTLEEKVQSIKKFHELGFAGTVLKEASEMKAVAQSVSSSIRSTRFTLFIRSDDNDPISYTENVNIMFPYTEENKSSIESLMLESRIANISTSIYLLDSHNRDPLMLASDVASLIDNTGGGGDFIWLTDGKDDLRQLVEELSYLDVAGPTIKSRLVVGAGETTQDQVEECLELGVNKFVLYDSQRLEWFREIVEREGKKHVKFPA